LPHQFSITSKTDGGWIAADCFGFWTHFVCRICGKGWGRQKRPQSAGFLKELPKKDGPQKSHAANEKAQREY